MNIISFKEQVFLIMLEKHKEPFLARADIVKESMVIVEKVCEEWGHDEQPHFLDFAGAMTIQNPDKVHSHSKCARCGKTIK